MIFCKHCKKQVKIHNRIDEDLYLWNHLKIKHPDVFKAEDSKTLEEMFHDNYTVDNPESDIEARFDKVF